MSDMLRLVVEISNIQCPTLPVKSRLQIGDLDDKLKHVGHLVVAFMVA
jgi:hypothetical protein